MKKILLMLSLAIFTIGLSIPNAEAARMGGGRSVGKQSNMTQRQAEPVHKQNTQQANQAAPTSNPAAAAQPQRNRWLGPIAGLAAGLGLAALASHFGFGEELANVMMIALLAMVALAVFGYFMRRRALALSPSAPSAQTEHNFARTQYATAGTAAEEVLDEASFIEHAKRYFTRLQAAYDKADYDNLREFTTTEMFTALYAEIEARKGAPNQTDVIQLNAQFLGVEKFGGEYTASVQFSGLIREQADAVAHDFTEIWHFSRPVKGEAGWVLAGIQQPVPV